MIKDSRKFLENKDGVLDVGEIIEINYRPIQHGCPGCRTSESIPVSYTIKLETKEEFALNVPVDRHSHGDDTEIYPIGTRVLIGCVGPRKEHYIIQRASSGLLSDYTYSRNASLQEGEKISATQHGNLIKFCKDGKIIIGGVTRDVLTREELQSSLLLGGNQGTNIITNEEYVATLKAGGSFLGFDKIGNFMLRMLQGFFLCRKLKISVADKLEIMVNSALGRLRFDVGRNIIFNTGQNFHVFVGTSEEDYPDEIVSTYLNSHGVTFLKGERLVIDLTGNDNVVKELEIICHDKDASIKIEKGDMAINVDTGKMDIIVNGDVHITTNGKARIEANGNVELKGANVVNQDGSQLVLTNKVVCPFTGNPHLANQFTVKAP